MSLVALYVLILLSMFGKCRWTKQSWQSLLLAGVLVCAFPVVGCSDEKRLDTKSPKVGDVFYDPLSGIEFVWIPKGCFIMGWGTDAYKTPFDEPAHNVCFDEGFWMGKFEVTQEQWQCVMGENPPFFNEERIGPQAANHPVEQVSWEDVNRFLFLLNFRAGTDKYHLPSEAQWEYAVRAGTSTFYFLGDKPENVHEYAWEDEDDETCGTHPVGQLRPNPWGLHDVYGNVEEWCADPLHEEYTGAPADGSVWEADGACPWRVVRGGQWSKNGDSGNSVYGSWDEPDKRDRYTGFRVVIPAGKALSERVQAKDSGDRGMQETTPEAGTILTDALSGMLFVWIPEGCFTMGRNTWGEEEWPAHTVCFDEGFWMGKFEVTQEQWRRVMGHNPSRFHEDELGRDTRTHPVERVSWNNVQVFLQTLNKAAGTDRYRLPSEAQWEYAAKVGTTTWYFFGNDEARLHEYAWYDHSLSTGSTSPVGQLKPNPWGLYDIYGNVEEWCADLWHDDYIDAPVDGSVWEADADTMERITRGGAYDSFFDFCTSTMRSSDEPDSKTSSTGFRIVIHSDNTQRHSR